MKPDPMMEDNKMRDENNAFLQISQIQGLLELLFYEKSSIEGPNKIRG